MGWASRANPGADERRKLPFARCTIIEVRGRLLSNQIFRRCTKRIGHGDQHSYGRWQKVTQEAVDAAKAEADAAEARTLAAAKAVLERSGIETE